MFNNEKILLSYARKKKEEDIINTNQISKKPLYSMRNWI